MLHSGNNGRTRTEWYEEIARRFRNFIIQMAAIYLCSIALVIWLMPSEPETFTGFGFHWWQIFLTAFIIHTIKSFRIVDAENVGSILFLGRPVCHLNSGLKFVPFGLATIKLGPRRQIQLEIGTPISTKREGEETFERKTDSDKHIYFDTEPMRVTSASSKSARYDDDAEEKIVNTKDDPLNNRTTLDPHVILTWKIENHPAFLEEEGDIDAANESIRRYGTSALSQIIGQLTPALAIYNMDKVNKHVTEQIEIKLGEADSGDKRYPWTGINFLSAQVSSWGLPRRVNIAQANAREAGFKAQATQTDADAQRYQKIALGEGEANALEKKGQAEAENKKQLLLAEAEGLKAKGHASKEENALIIAMLEAVEDGLKTSDHTYVVGAPLFNLLNGAEEMIKGIKARQQAAQLPDNQNSQATGT